MQTFFLVALLTLVTMAVNAQTFLPGGFINYNYRGNPVNNINFSDSASQKKWSVTKYSSLSTTFSFFKGGNATVVAMHQWDCN